MGGFTPGPFSVPDFDSVPYDIECLDQNNSVVPLPAGAVLELASDNANAAVVPNSTDPSGATGNVIAAVGYNGAVSGTASLQLAAVVGGNTPPPITGTWSGTFQPGTPLTIQIAFGAAIANAAGGGAAPASAKGGRSGAAAKHI